MLTRQEPECGIVAVVGPLFKGCPSFGIEVGKPSNLGQPSGALNMDLIGLFSAPDGTRLPCFGVLRVEPGPPKAASVSRAGAAERATTKAGLVSKGAKDRKESGTWCRTSRSICPNWRNEALHVPTLILQLLPPFVGCKPFGPSVLRANSRVQGVTSCRNGTRPRCWPSRAAVQFGFLWTLRSRLRPHRVRRRFAGSNSHISFFGGGSQGDSKGDPTTGWETSGDRVFAPPVPTFLFQRGM